GSGGREGGRENKRCGQRHDQSRDSHRPCLFFFLLALPLQGVCSAGVWSAWASFWPMILASARPAPLQRSRVFWRRPFLPPCIESTNFDTGVSGTVAKVVRSLPPTEST